MTLATNEPLTLPSTRSGGAASEATKVEVSRAIAEVQAAVTVAKACPRDVAAAWAEMDQACRRLALANRAFYTVPNRGTKKPSIHLAREMARIWGNNDCGVQELNRDDARGVSEVLAFAWDQQANTRVRRQFLVPHQRMATDRQTKEKIRVDLFDLQDIYQMNQNIGARALRECIAAMLPAEFWQAAQERCSRTIEQGDGSPLPDRITAMVKVMGEMGVSVPQMEARLGHRRKDWTAWDLAEMQVAHSTILNEGLPVDEVFPPIEAPATTEVTATAIATARRARTAAEPATEPVQAASPHVAAGPPPEPPAAKRGAKAEAKPDPAHEPITDELVAELGAMGAARALDGLAFMGFVEETLGFEGDTLGSLHDLTQGQGQAVKVALLALDVPPRT